MGKNKNNGLYDQVFATYDGMKHHVSMVIIVKNLWRVTIFKYLSCKLKISLVYLTL